jgi:hypothetical protein
LAETQILFLRAFVVIARRKKMVVLAASGSTDLNNSNKKTHKHWKAMNWNVFGDYF